MDDKFSDEVLGRARVKNNEKLASFYDDLKNYSTGALWEVANDIEPWEPAAPSVPYHWSYEVTRKHVVQSIDLVTPEEAARRVVYFSNPGALDKSACVGWLYSGIQGMKPGERAPAHAHSSSALRFIIEGKGAYTVVDHHKVPLGGNDFVITPNGVWHDHGIAEDGEISIWQDGLDIPLAKAMDASFYSLHPEGYQPIDFPIGDLPTIYGAPGLLPVNHNWDKPYSPMFKYPWDKTYEALKGLEQMTDGCEFDGIIMRYTNPINGGHVMSTMGAHMQLLREGEHTKAHRHTGSIVYHVAKGQGYSVIGGKKFEWKEHDVFVVPSWVWHEHCNTNSKDDACLFSFNDLPTIEKMNFYREEAYTENGGHQEIVA